MSAHNNTALPPLTGNRKYGRMAAKSVQRDGGYYWHTEASLKLLYEREDQLRAALQALAAADAARDEALEINRHHERNDHYLSTDIPQLDNPMTVAGIKEAFEYGGEKCTCVCCDHARHLMRLVERVESAEAKLAEVEKKRDEEVKSLIAQLKKCIDTKQRSLL